MNWMTNQLTESGFVAGRQSSDQFIILKYVHNVPKLILWPANFWSSRQDFATIISREFTSRLVCWVQQYVRQYVCHTWSTFNNRYYVEEHRKKAKEVEGEIRICITTHCRLGDWWYENELQADKDDKKQSERHGTMLVTKKSKHSRLNRMRSTNAK
jgi:hypothetical protein